MYVCDIYACFAFCVPPPISSSMSSSSESSSSTPPMPSTFSRALFHWSNSDESKDSCSFLLPNFKLIPYRVCEKEREREREGGGGGREKERRRKYFSDWKFEYHILTVPVH